MTLPLAQSFAAERVGIRPLGKDGKPLNLNFEDGTLKDWTATGKAFEGLPIKGDTVAQRRADMKSQHEGNYWIGTFEKAGDASQGTLTSVPFKVTEPFASFLIAGGPLSPVSSLQADLMRKRALNSSTQPPNFLFSSFPGWKPKT
jgi:hypothetical protein